MPSSVNKSNTRYLFICIFCTNGKSKTNALPFFPSVHIIFVFFEVAKIQNFARRRPLYNVTYAGTKAKLSSIYLT